MLGIDNDMASSINIQLNFIKDEIKEIKDVLKVGYVTQDQHKLLIQRVEIAEKKIDNASKREAAYIFLIIAETVGLVYFVSRALLTS